MRPATTALLPLVLAPALGCSAPAAHQATDGGASPSAPAPARSSAAAAVERACAEALAALHARTGVPGVSFAAVLPDGTCVELAHGLADLEEGRPLEPGARMLAGSTGKTFFSALALALAAEGAVSLDDPLEDWLGEEPWFPRLPNADAGITLRQLLDHTSGIHEYYLQPSFRPVLSEEPRRRWEVPELLAFVFDLPPLFAPGEGWSYADTNYLLAGLVLERVAGGDSVYTQVAERFTGPLGLDDTLPSTRPDLPGLTPGYTSTPNYFQLPGKLYVADGHYLDPSFEYCGGGYLSSAGDLARWAKALFSGAAIDADYLDDLLAAHPARVGVPHRYGLGAQLFDTELGELRGHTGFFPGYLTAMGWLPEHDLAVALQVNTDDSRGFGRYITFELEELAQVVVDVLAATAEEPGC